MLIRALISLLRFRVNALLQHWQFHHKLLSTPTLSTAQLWQSQFFRSLLMLIVETPLLFFKITWKAFRATKGEIYSGTNIC